jgi:hypothetical protein
MRSTAEPGQMESSRGTLLRLLRARAGRSVLPRLAREQKYVEGIVASIGQACRQGGNRDRSWVQWSGPRHG